MLMQGTTSKTGMLDMGQLHTYKYNDDIFAKVTTLFKQKSRISNVLRLVWFNGTQS